MTTKPPESYPPRWLHLSTVQGYIAMWAVRQSPYHNPDSLGLVLEEFRVSTRHLFDSNEMAEMSRKQMKDLLKEFLYPIKHFQLWNERKNGNKAPFHFVSIYDGPRNPDDDFIDLEALIGNVVREMFNELDRDFPQVEEFKSRGKREWFSNRWLAFKRRLFPCNQGNALPGA